MVRNSKKLVVAGVSAKITKLVESESDRGAILILGAYLDELLAELIRAGCVSDKAADGLLEFGQAAGDFNSRIELAAAIGLIHSSEREGLHTLRRIRNAAAHFDKGGRGFEVLFDSEATANQVASLASTVNLSLPSRDPQEVREFFIVCCRFIAIRLMFRSITAARPEEPVTLKEIANSFRTQMKGTPQGEWLQKIEASIGAGEMDELRQFLREAVTRFSRRGNESPAPPENPENETGTDPMPNETRNTD